MGAAEVDVISDVVPALIAHPRFARPTLPLTYDRVVALPPRTITAIEARHTLLAMTTNETSEGVGFNWRASHGHAFILSAMVLSGPST
jgi:hypothetical protein